jgi:4-carboxymuconolactone decarboxylase
MPDSQPPRIPPLEPPYEPAVEAHLAKWMPPGSNVEPLKLFRVLLRNQPLAERMRPLGAAILGSGSSLDIRRREIVIDRVCARCRCEYEWGVHATAFGAAAGLSEAALRATAISPASAPVWQQRDALLIRLVDELHDTARVSDDLWSELSSWLSEQQLLELLVVAGFYHAISYVANAARVPLEDWAARFPA